MATKSEWWEKTIHVRHIAKPSGKNHDNPPNLKDFREFLQACEGLPDDTHVFVEKGKLDEGGRHNYTFSVRIVERQNDTDGR